MELIISAVAGSVLFFIITALYEMFEIVDGESNRIGKLYEKLKRRSWEKNDDIMIKKPKAFRLFKNNSKIKNNSRIFYFCLVFAAVYVLLLCFTGSTIISLVTGSASCLLLRLAVKYLNDREKMHFSDQFKQWLLCLNGSIKAGMSLEEAIKGSKAEMLRLYGSYEKVLLGEYMDSMLTGLKYGKPVSQVLEDFKNECRNDEVNDFVTAVRVIGEKGGNLVEVIDNVCFIINEKIGTKQEIKVMLAGRRLESRIVTIAPVVLVILMSIISPDYMGVMYKTFAGNIITCVSVILIVFSFIVAERIMEIEI